MPTSRSPAARPSTSCPSRPAPISASSSASASPTRPCSRRDGGDAGVYFVDPDIDEGPRPRDDQATSPVLHLLRHRQTKRKLTHGRRRTLPRRHAGHAKPKHDYHLVNPSPGRSVGSIAAFVMAHRRRSLFMRPTSTPWVLLIGLAGVLYTMIAWWTRRRSRRPTRATTPRWSRIGLRYGMILFIASEVMFFVAWFWIFFEMACSTTPIPTQSTPRRPPGPPGRRRASSCSPFHLPLVNTLLLLTSGTTVTWAHHALHHGDREGPAAGASC